MCVCVCACVRVRAQLPVPLAHAFCRRLMGRLCALMVGSATLNNTHTRQQACEHKDLTDTKAIRCVTHTHTHTHTHRATVSYPVIPWPDVILSMGSLHVCVCVCVYRVAEVLLLLLNRIAGASAAIHDSLDCRLFHTLRTPQVRVTHTCTHKHTHTHMRCLARIVCLPELACALPLPVLVTARLRRHGTRAVRTHKRVVIVCVCVCVCVCV